MKNNKRTPYNVVYAYVAMGTLFSLALIVHTTLITNNDTDEPPEDNELVEYSLNDISSHQRTLSKRSITVFDKNNKNDVNDTNSRSSNNNRSNKGNLVDIVDRAEHHKQTSLMPQVRASGLRRRLLGFRCDHTKHVTSDGIATLEADKPVQLTLFGENLTKDTLIAFTFESSRPDHDCTDNDRIVSYRLRESDIISPSIVKLTVNLPAPSVSMLSESKNKNGRHNKGGNQNYYFCIKYAPLPLEKYAEDDQDNAYEYRSDPDALNRSLPDSIIIDGLTPEFEPWVHQGINWWLTLSVEQPLVTVSYEILLIILLLLLSAVTSGLNLGLMSLDMNELAVIRSCGSDTEKSFAKTIEPLRRRGNYLLCSLLLGNVLVNSTLTVILEDLSSGLVAVIGSTIAIVVLGEIVPQAFCSRHGLAIGARTVLMTYAFMLLTFPLSYPISKMLDWMLGEEIGNCYDRERLMEFIRITGHQSRLDNDEVAIIAGALKLKKINVSEIMTRLDDVFMLPYEAQLDLATIQQILTKGYSRVPIYEQQDRHQVCGLLLARDLALIDARDCIQLSDYLQHYRHPLIYLDDDVTLDVALNEFKTGKSHMAIVRQIYDDGDLDRYYEANGVVTLEDVVEEVLQVEINDETDTLSDNRRKKRRNTNLTNATNLLALAPFMSKAVSTTILMPGDASSAPELLKVVSSTDSDHQQPHQEQQTPNIIKPNNGKSEEHTDHTKSPESPM